MNFEQRLIIGHKLLMR